MDNEFDTFVAGVEPGGLRNLTQIKILIIYLLISVNEPLSVSLFTDALQLHGTANYFSIIEAIDELCKNELLTRDGEMLSLNEKGRSSYRDLSDELPLSVRETALADVTNLHILEKNEKENFVEISHYGQGYNVTFKVLNGGTALMDLTLYATDIEQAERLKHNFIKNPSKIYSSVVSALYI